MLVTPGSERVNLHQQCTCLFAHDTLVYSTTESTNHVANLQLDLIALEQWTQKWQMRLIPALQSGHPWYYAREVKNSLVKGDGSFHTVYILSTGINT